MKPTRNRMPACLTVALTGSLLIAPVQAVEMASLFDPYQQLLDRHLTEAETTSGGLVSAFDYDAALEEAETETLLNEQTQALAEYDPSTLDEREAALAFWNNAYNYFMIETILTEKVDGELVDSVWDYGGRYNPFADNVFQWKDHTIGGKDYSLDQIEKGVLLGDTFEDRGWKEARVHFTVNCASVGCPPLRKTIYTADNMESLMTENTQLAMKTDHQLRIDGTTLHASQLFDWYTDDFNAEAGSIRGFIKDYVSEERASRVADTESIKFIEYDWSLNRPEHFPEIQNN